MKRFFFFLIALPSFFDPVHGQQKKLQVGDTLPQLNLTNLINYPTKEITIPVFSGKWLILDFWNTGCSGCTEAFPKLAKLQNEFLGKIIWLTVTTQSKEQVIHFLQLHKKFTGFGMSLPVVCGDSLLNNYFQPDGYPHCVWIDSSGIVRSVTDGLEVSESHIKAILSNSNFKMIQKDDSFITTNNILPLYNSGNGLDGKKLLYSTTLSGYLHYVPWVNGYHSQDSGNSSITAFNVPIKLLYQIAFNDDEGYGNLYYLNDSRVQLNVRDTSRYVYIVDGEMKFENLYCYQAILPKHSTQELKIIMQNDLKKYFLLNARMERKNRVCWVLSARDTLLFKSKGGKEWADLDNAGFKATFTNCTFDHFRAIVEHVMLGQSPYPFINEIPCSEGVDITMSDIRDNDPNSYVTALKKYGISLKLENRIVNILVIDEVK